MTRQDLVGNICPSEEGFECKGNCSRCDSILNRWFDEYDEPVKDAIWDGMQRGRVDAINAIKNDLHKRLIEEMNKPYQDQSLCQGLLYGIQRCDWYLDDSKEQSNLE